MFLFGLGEGRAVMDPLILMIVALAIDAYVGDMTRLFALIPHPVVLIGRWIGWLDAKLNRDKRSQMNRAVRGLVTVIMVVVPCAVIGWAIAWLGRNYPFGWILETMFLVSLVAQKSLYDHVRRVGIALRDEGLDGGRREVAHIVGRDPLQLDNHGVARAAIESLAENYSDAVVAPVFWFTLFGTPGLLVYKAVNTMDSMIGHRTEKYRAFGMAAARIDDVLNLFPARLSGLFIVIASMFVPKANPAKALKTMLRDAGKHRSPNAGWPEGATAGALGLALAGPRRYREAIVKDDWIGDGKARAEPVDIKKALYLFVVACLLNGAWLAALVLVRIG